MRINEVTLEKLKTPLNVNGNLNVKICVHYSGTVLRKRLVIGQGTEFWAKKSHGGSAKPPPPPAILPIRVSTGQLKDYRKLENKNCSNLKFNLNHRFP